MRHPNYHDISQRFRRKNDWSDDSPLQFPEEGFDIYFLSADSRNGRYLLGHPEYRCEEHGLSFPGEPSEQLPVDAEIRENLNFRYPLVRGHRGTAPLHRQHRGIILLHGLNERSFGKYIPWAYHLCAQALAPVLLYPLTFHINRVRREWGAEQQESYTRRTRIAENENTHRFNAIISERLGSHPERFFWGALQSYWDLVDLLRRIREGRHLHFAPDARIDIVGYSAGGYVALALLLEDQERLFRESRGVLFATCAAVRDTNLASHFILDLMAEVALMKVYVKYRERLMNPRLKHWITAHPEGRWLDAFCGLVPDRSMLQDRLKAIAPRLLGIANTNDAVMPPGAMLNALQGPRRNTGVRVEEFPMGIHENPFACPDYRERHRKVITEFMDEARYGKVFEEFVKTIVTHLR